MIDALLSEKLLETSRPIDNFGWTLLHKAVYENNVQLVDVLLAHGNCILHILSFQKCMNIYIHSFSLA